MSDRPMNRRRFFREGIFELLRPLADVVEPLAEAAKQLGELEKIGQPAPPTPSYGYTPPATQPVLRPPGALSEDSFMNVCSRCGDCMRVCPAQCIIMDSTGAKAGGGPYIDADYKPCILCEGLVCNSSCPTGALVPTLLENVKMGLAEWHQDTCLRHNGDSCTVCIDKCPLGARAIRLNDSGGIEVLNPGCTGCGVCQHECPTYPKSITVAPIGNANSAQSDMDYYPRD